MSTTHLVRDGTVHPSLIRHVVRHGRIEEATGSVKLLKLPNTGKVYGNVQLDDYEDRARREFLWRPPLRLTVRARFSHPAGQLRGTAGFGLWNDPFLMTGPRVPALPRAIWFFYSSSPSDMDLALDVPGHGWKAATIDARRLPFLLLAPAAPFAVPLMRWTPLYRRLWPIAQRAMQISERFIPFEMDTWHTYQLEWRKNAARFVVDGQDVLACDTAPGGPLGLVIWLDNQYMVIKPWGKLRHGLVGSESTEWLEIESVAVEQPG